MIHIGIAAWYATRREWEFIRKGMPFHTQTKSFFWLMLCDVEHKRLTMFQLRQAEEKHQEVEARSRELEKQVNFFATY